jgi:predicted enzyme related to lactoylglutathione lyase
MSKVIGFGGVFMETSDREATHLWYEKHLGIKLESWGAVFQPTELLAKSPKATQVMSFFTPDSGYVKPSTAPFMINLIVDDLDALVINLKTQGVLVMDFQETEFGNFAWIMDPNGVKVELWQP